MQAPSMISWKRDEINFLSGGRRCAARLFMPQASRSVPCVVLGHGFGGIMDLLTPYAEAFANEGWAALTFDYRNFGHSEGEPRQVLDIPGQLDDWAGAFALASSLPGVDAAQIAIWGSSLGGGHVISFAAREPRVRAVITQAPMVDGFAAVGAVPLRQKLRLTPAVVRDFIAKLRGGPRFYLPLLGDPGDQAVMTSDASADFLKQHLVLAGTARMDIAALSSLAMLGYAPAKVIAKIGCPILMIVADRDGTTPAEVAVAAAKQAKDCRVLRYPLQHFDIYVGDHFKTIVAEQKAFLHRHFTPGAASASR